MTLDLDAIEARAKTGWEPATWNAENGKAKPERICFLLHQSIDEAQAAVLSLTAEVRKLKEALQRIADKIQTGDYSEYGAGYDQGLEACAVIAREALKGTQS